MPTEVTLSIVDSKNQHVASKTIKVENESVLKTIMPDYAKGVTAAEYTTLCLTALTNKNDVLENVDIGLSRLKSSIKSGNADYDTMNILNPLDWLTVAGQAIDKQKIGDQITITNLPSSIKTLGDAKRYYNLPDGALRHMWTSSGHISNFDNEPIPADCIYFNARSYAEHNGLTLEQLKNFFDN